MPFQTLSRRFFLGASLRCSWLIWGLTLGGAGMDAADGLELALPVDLAALPRLTGTRVRIANPTPAQTIGTTEMVVFRDRVFVAWSSVDATTPHWTRTWIASSRDGTSWSDPNELGAETREAYLAYWLRESGQTREEGRPYHMLLEPSTLHVADARLYVWARAAIDGAGRGRVFSTSDGAAWNEYPPHDLDRLEREPALRIRNTGSHRGFARLDDGRLLAACLSETGALGQFCAPVSRDRTGLSGWEKGWTPTRHAPPLKTPNVWQGPDAQLHFVAHDGTALWHSFSQDRGNAWSKLRRAKLATDATPRQFAALRDGRVLFVGDVAGEPLLAISHDGWRFAQVARLPTKLRCANSLLKKCFESRFESFSFRLSASKRSQPAWFPSFDADDSGRKGPKRDRMTSSTGC